MSSLPQLLVVEDQAMVATALATALTMSERLHVVGQPKSLSEVADFARASRKVRIDVVLADFFLQDGSGVELSALVSRHWPSVPLLFISAHPTKDMRRHIVEAGGRGLLSKAAPFERLVDAVLVTAAGGTCFDSGVPQIEDATPKLLTEREIEVLAAFATGRSTLAIAHDLAISPHTVRNHARTILEKLDVHSRLAAVALATKLGIIR